jgi:hypothetical protein
VQFLALLKLPGHIPSQYLSWGGSYLQPNIVPHTPWAAIYLVQGLGVDLHIAVIGQSPSCVRGPAWLLALWTSFWNLGKSYYPPPRICVMVSWQDRCEALCTALSTLGEVSGLVRIPEEVVPLVLPPSNFNHTARRSSVCESVCAGSFASLILIFLKSY